MSRLVLGVLVVAVVAVTVSTAGTIVTDGPDESDRLTDDVIAYPDPGPNGVYAYVEDGEVTIDVTPTNPALEADGIAAAARVDDVVRLENRGDEPVTVWLESDADRLEYHGEDGPIDAAEDAVTLAAGETVPVGFAVDTGAVAPGETVTDVFRIHVATADGSAGPDEPDGSASVHDSPANATSDTSARAAALSVTALSVSPHEPVVGEPTEIAVTIRNDGDRTATYAGRLTAGNETLERIETSVGPGQETTVVVDWEPENAGTHDVEIDDVTTTVAVHERDVAPVSPDPSTSESPDWGESATAAIPVATLVLGIGCLLLGVIVRRVRER